LGYPTERVLLLTTEIYAVAEAKCWEIDPASFYEVFIEKVWIAK